MTDAGSARPAAEDPAAEHADAGHLTLGRGAGDAPRSLLSDGEWHRVHPLTPLLRGGLVLLVVIGIVVSNFRDRLIAVFLPSEIDVDLSGPESGAIDYILANNLILWALLAILGVLLIVVGILYLSWRAHSFRITGDDVEVRSGVLFRTHRRAPLDRVQGVNLTRPMIARLLGAAKLEVVGAGLDANVKLEYLSTANAEAVRADILRLASGRQLAEARAAAAAQGVPISRAAAGAVTAGLAGLIDGVDTDEDEPESLVHILPGRLIASHLLSGSTIWLLLLLVAVVLGSVFGSPWVLFTIVPTMIGFATYWFRSITRALRYSIAPTRSGVRITFGLFTTITEVLPPGRVHAFEIRQPVLWRPFGWWQIRVNRMSGRSATDTQSLQFADVLPVGTRADVERVLRLFLPDISAPQWSEIAEHGMFGPQRVTDELVEDGSDAPVQPDPYTTTPRRARWLKPISWRRNGFLLTPAALLLRRGRLQRELVILPLARLQSVHVRQGPVARGADVAGVVADTVLGQVSGRIATLDRADAVALWLAVAASVVAAAGGDRSHRWGAEAAPGDAGAAASTPEIAS